MSNLLTADNLRRMKRYDEKLAEKIRKTEKSKARAEKIHKAILMRTELFLVRYNEGLSITEIGRAFDMSANRVRILLNLHPDFKLRPKKK